MEDFKPMLPFGDSTIAIHIVNMMNRLGMDPIVVVTGYQSEKLMDHLSETGVRFVKNDRFKETEMFDSVVLGIRAVMEECERILIMPVDTPAIMPDTIRQTLRIDAQMVRTLYHGKPGHPVIIDRDAVEALCGYRGEGGLRGAMEHCGVPITNMEVEDEGVCRDVDTKEEYLELIEWNYQRGEGHPIQPKIQVRLSASEVFFGPGTCQLLELIEQTGSLQEACMRMGLSYSKGSKMLKAVDRQLGFPVVQRWAGGFGGGGSVLTAEGRRLIKNYQCMVAEVQKNAEDIYQKYFGKGFRS